MDVPEVPDDLDIMKGSSFMGQMIHGQMTCDISVICWNKSTISLSRMESEATSEIPLTSDEVGAAAECGTVQKRL